MFAIAALGTMGVQVPTVVVVVEVVVDVVVATVVVVVATVVVVEATVLVVVATVLVVEATVLVVVATVLEVEATVLVVTVVVVGRVVVVVVSRGAVVDVVPPPHPPPVHASQQLGCVPTQALPPFGAVQASAPFMTLHVVVPLASVRQQVTAPGFPHVELDAQFMTVLAQSSGSVPDFTAAFVAWATQLT